MPENISEAHALIINLQHAAAHHKRTCSDSACCVSLLQLREAAKVLRTHALDSEQAEISQRIRDFTWC